MRKQYDEITEREIEVLLGAGEAFPAMDIYDLPPERRVSLSEEASEPEDESDLSRPEDFYTDDPDDLEQLREADANIENIEEFFASSIAALESE